MTNKEELEKEIEEPKNEDIDIKDDDYGSDDNEESLQDNELIELRAKVDDYLYCLQRERADFANYKRRTDEERSRYSEKLLGDHVRLFLPVIDDLELALNHVPSDPDCASWIDGIAMIHKKLLSSLEQQNVIVIDLKPGDLFDPNNQEAITHEEDENYTDGQIIEVVRTGYQLNDRIIRPASVRVAK